MKKNMIKLLVPLVILAFAATAFAAQVISSTTSIGGLAFSPSNNVHVQVSSGTVAYTAESLHKSGSRLFGTDSTASIIYWQDAAIQSTSPDSSFTSGLAASTTAGQPGTPAFATVGGWNSM